MEDLLGRRILKRSAPVAHRCRTVFGTLQAAIDDAECESRRHQNREARTGKAGITVLKGNLAPRGAIIKPLPPP